MMTSHAHTWFEATIGEHRIRLGLNGLAQTAPHAAIALYQVDTSLQAIAQWLGTDPVWHWLDPQGGASRPATSRPGEANATSARTPPPDGRLLLDLPAALEQALPPAPASLAQKLKTPLLSAQLVAASFRLGSAEISMLEAGGALMLAESTEPAWTGLLRSPDSPDRPVVIHAPEKIQRLAVADKPCTGDIQHAADLVQQTGLNVEVRLGGLLNVPSMCLREEFDGVVDLTGAQDQMRLVSLWPAGNPATPLATGELTPLGRGWAMLIEKVFPIQTTLATLSGEW